MPDQIPTSRKVPPLAIIVVVVLVALVVVAFANMRGKTHTPSGMMSAPQAQPASEPVMPQQSTVPNAQQPASDEKGAMGHQGTADDRVNETTANRTEAPSR